MSDRSAPEGTTQKGPAAFHVLAKPTGAACNLDCRYCFYLSKEALYPGSRFRMSDDVLEAYIQQLLWAHRVPDVSVSWQGGEPTLMGLDFFRRSVQYVDRHRRSDQQVAYSLQTNGTLLDAEWCAFFRENRFLIGLSVDGPQGLHDEYRVDKGGMGTFDRVLRGWEQLNKHGVDVNMVCTVHSANADHPLEVYRFFRDELGARFIQFIPIVERVTANLLPRVNAGWGGTATGQRPFYLQAGSAVTRRSVKPKQYGGFLTSVFDEWVHHDVGRVYVQMFDAALANWLGEPAGVCVFEETCGAAPALEHNGDLYACDHFVEPGYRLGNILKQPIAELMASEDQHRFGQDKRDRLPRCCRECDVRFACHGECPRNRFSRSPRGEPGLNYLCAGLKLFFRHVDLPMRIMASLLRQGRAPSEVMRLLPLEEARLRPVLARADREERCPCGSGRKYRDCHGKSRMR
jgi:uncharacterized protein